MESHKIEFNYNFSALTSSPSSTIVVISVDTTDIERSRIILGGTVSTQLFLANASSSAELSSVDREPDPDLNRVLIPFEPENDIGEFDIDRDSSLEIDTDSSLHSALFIFFSPSP